jgi:hypothetical protein
MTRSAVTPAATVAATPRAVLTRGWKAAGIALSIMPLIGALADGVLSWGETTFLAVVGLVFIGVVMVGLTRIMLRRIAKPRSAAAVRRGGSRALRAMTWLLILGYVGLVAVLTTYGRDLPWFLWIALVIWVIGMLGLTIMQSRAENLLSDNARPRAEFGFYTALFIVGVGLLGLGAATIGVAVNALRAGEWFIFATVGVEALAIVLVGALVLTARHIVVALGLLGLGIVAVGFGVGSIFGGDALFGSGVVAVGGATLLSAAATARLSDPWTALAYFVTGAACLFAAFTSWNQGEWVLAFAFFLVGAVLCAATVFALSISDKDMATLFRFPNNQKVWSMRRYAIVAVSAAVAVAVASAWLANTWRDGRGPGLFAVGGIAVALLAVEIALIVALTRRKAAVPVPRARAPRAASSRTPSG